MANPAYNPSCALSTTSARDWEKNLPLVADPLAKPSARELTSRSRLFFSVSVSSPHLSSSVACRSLRTGHQSASPDSGLDASPAIPRFCPNHLDITFCHISVSGLLLDHRRDAIQAKKDDPRSHVDPCLHLSTHPRPRIFGLFDRPIISVYRVKIIGRSVGLSQNLAIRQEEPWPATEPCSGIIIIRQLICPFHNHLQAPPHTHHH